MKNKTKLLLTILISLSLSACTTENNDELDETITATQNLIVLSDKTATIDGKKIDEYDYSWNISPAKKEAWYEGDEPSGDIYIAHDIVYYPELNEDGFIKKMYDGETEYVYYYTAEGLTDYIFSTLPVLGDDVPTAMMHSKDEAYQNRVLHICKAGTYTLTGYWHGQILIDLGEAAYGEEEAIVTLILDDVEVVCDVASGICFKNVYEADNAWEDRETYSGEINVGTMNTGANIVIADDSENNITGSNVYRLLKPDYKKDSTSVQKKYYKIDGALYSYMSMNINGQEKGNGILNITSTTFEGLNTELHLAINGGNINIRSQDDGINCNEDHVSVVTINGGKTTIFAGLGAEGDGIDSNGYVTINGGELWALASPYSDNGIDSEDGIQVNGGTVIALGSNMGTSAYVLYIDGEKQYAQSSRANIFDDERFGEFTPGDFEGMTPPDKPEGNFNPDNRPN